MSARDFVERELRKDPDISYAEIQARAAHAGLNVQRFLYGSTRRSLGLPPRPEPVVGAPPEAHVEASASTMMPPPADAVDDVASIGALGPEAEAASAAEAGEPAAAPAAPKGRAFEFAVQTLRMSPDISYQDLRARADMAGMVVPPIVYGRAKALLGLVPTRPRRSKTEPPRLLRQVDSAQQVDRLPALDGIRSLEHLVQTVRALEQERQLLRAALAAIQQAVTEALAED